MEICFYRSTTAWFLIVFFSLQVFWFFPVTRHLRRIITLALSVGFSRDHKSKPVPAPPGMESKWKVGGKKLLDVKKGRRRSVSPCSSPLLFLTSKHTFRFISDHLAVCQDPLCLSLDRIIFDGNEENEDDRDVSFYQKISLWIWHHSSDYPFSQFFYCFQFVYLFPVEQSSNWLLQVHTVHRLVFNYSLIFCPFGPLKCSNSGPLCLVLSQDGLSPIF